MANTKDIEQLMREANDITATAQQALDAADAFYRDQGLDPEKVRAVLAGQLDDKGQAEAKSQFEQDMAEVERDVAEEAARASFAAAPQRAGGVKKPRLMV